MLQSYSLFTDECTSNHTSIESNQSFTVESILWSTIKKNNIDDLYEQIVFKVQRNPKNLMSHMQRIYATYNQKMVDPLYAALIDLLLALDGKGKGLASRMILCTKSMLLEQQYNVLDNYLKNQDSTLLSGNKFTVLTKGLIGTPILLSSKDINNAKNNNGKADSYLR